MKTVLVLSVLLCAAFAAPAEDIEMTAETTVETPQEQMTTELEKVTEEITQPEPHVYCPRDWHEFDSRCFMAVSTRKSWFAAKVHCNILGGHLAAATSDEEYRFLQVLADEARLKTAWLGGFYLQDRWLWSDRDEFFELKWYTRTYLYIDNPCLFLRDDNGWGNKKCSYLEGFICSKNPFGY